MSKETEKKRINQFEPWFGEEEIKELADTIRSTWIIEHTRTRKLEEIFANYVGSRYAVATTSGSMALSLALMALGVGFGDEVIIPDFTFIGTANAVKMVGANPVFADIKKENLNIDPDEVGKKINDKTKAIIPVHLNGRSCDMDRINEIADENGLYVIEDASQTLGSRWRGRHLGTFSQIGCFSLATTKIITTGQGGMLVTDDDKLYERIQRLKDHGRFDRAKLKPVRDYHPVIGFNFKFTDLQAAVGLAQFSKLEWRVQRMKEIYKLYLNELKEIGSIKFIKTDLKETTPWYIDVLLNESGENKELKKYLNEKGIGCRLFYKPLHLQPCYSIKKDFPNATYISERGLWLPSSTFLTNKDIGRVCHEIRTFFARAGLSRNTSTIKLRLSE